VSFPFLFLFLFPFPVLDFPVSCSLLSHLSDDDGENEAEKIFKGASDQLSELPLKSVLQKVWKTSEGVLSFVQAADRGPKAFAEKVLEELKTSSRFKLEKSASYEEWAHQFTGTLDKVHVNSALSIAMVSIANSRMMFDSANYNYKLPVASHRVSGQHNSLILFHAPALRGYNYLSPKASEGPI